MELRQTAGLVQKTLGKLYLEMSWTWDLMPVKPQMVWLKFLNANLHAMPVHEKLSTLIDKILTLQIIKIINIIKQSSNSHHTEVRIFHQPSPDVSSKFMNQIPGRGDSSGLLACDVAVQQLRAGACPTAFAWPSSRRRRQGRQGVGRWPWPDGWRKG